MPLYRGLATIEAMTQARPGGFDMGERYRVALDQCADNFAEALGFLAGADSTVLFHCTAGKDRTGLIAALLLLNAGATRDAVIADYALTASYGAGLMDVLRAKACARGGAPEHVERVLGSKPETMAATLDWLDESYGGVEPYLRGIGLSDETRATLKARLAG